MGDPTQAPRNPSEYTLSTHAYQRRKNRGIQTRDITQTIENGIVQEARGGYPTVKFVYVPIGAEDAVGVVANAEKQLILTVVWDFDCNHPRVNEWREERGIIA